MIWLLFICATMDSGYECKQIESFETMETCEVSIQAIERFSNGEIEDIYCLESACDPLDDIGGW